MFSLTGSASSPTYDSWTALRRFEQNFHVVLYQYFSRLPSHMRSIYKSVFPDGSDVLVKNFLLSWIPGMYICGIDQYLFPVLLGFMQGSCSSNCACVHAHVISLFLSYINLPVAYRITDKGIKYKMFKHPLCSFNEQNLQTPSFCHGFGSKPYKESVT